MKNQLLKDIYYLNMKEYQTFCRDAGIPIQIHIETSKGLKKLPVKDRKEIIIRRIHEFIKTGKVPSPTILNLKVVKFEALKDITPRTRICYGQYDKKNLHLLRLLKSLTDSEFRDGMIAREVLRDFWCLGKAPSVSEFAKVWMKASREEKSRPHYAYLADLSEGTYDENWKKTRIQKSKNALSWLYKLIDKKKGSSPSSY